MNFNACCFKSMSIANALYLYCKGCSERFTVRNLKNDEA